MPIPAASRILAARRLLVLVASCGALLAPGAAAQTNLSSPTPAPPLMCSPPAGGATCDPGKGPATLGGIGNGGLELGAGNPINLVTGNKYQRETDMAALPGVLGLEIVRHYNSAYSREHSRSGILGRGWKLSYETSLHISARNLQVLQADGSRIVFDRDPAQPDHCASHDAAHGTLHIEATPAGTRYRWQWPDGERLYFDDGGRLTHIHAPSGEFLRLQYRADGALVQVTDPQGRSLHLSYPSAGDPKAGGQFYGVRHIDSPRGRFSYLHGEGDSDSQARPAASAEQARARAANLLAVRLPAAAATVGTGIERRYHYEDARHPSLLTGISVSGSGSDGVAMNERIASWEYDERGRAVRSVRGAREARDEEVELRYLRPATTTSTGITEIRNSLDQLTRYHHRIIGGEYRIVEAHGPGCASCAPSNRRYRYDEAGRVLEIAVLAADAAASQEVLATTYYLRDAGGRVIAIEELQPGTTPAASLRSVQHLTYEDARWPARPTRIARPSVVAGAEHVLNLRFNAAGQLAEVHETGFSPLPADASSPLTAALAPAAIERRLRYHYVDINGRSVLSSVDGPLPTGALGSPEDSDITELHWDERADFVRAVIRPGGRRSEFIRDARSGLTTSVRDADGYRADFEFDVHGQLATVRATPPAGPAVVHTRLRDALGHDSELGSGSPDEGDFRAFMRLAYDHSGRLQWTADARGILTEYRRDREGRLLESARRSASMSQRLAARDGNAEGRTHELATPLRSRADAQFWPFHRIDDFGRQVATTSPDSGETRRDFDLADRLIWMRDAVGNVAHYEYTVDGRIARQSVTAASDGSTTLTHWRYSGPHLLSVEHPTQDQAFEYDAHGLRVARIATLRTAAGTQRLRTDYEHDVNGQLLASTLADGSRIQYVRNGQGQVVAIERNPVRHRWLRALVRPQRIVSELERDLVGVRRYQTGNGIEALHQRSAHGVLARIAYRQLQRSPAPALLRAAIRAANAQAAAPAAQAAESADFGAPIDPDAVVDLRYLWDEAGKLRLQRSRAASAVLDSHAYDGSARLIASLRAAEPERADASDDANTTAHTAESWRYAYDVNGRRVLAQQGSRPDDFLTGTEHSAFEATSHRFADVVYDANGQPLSAHSRRYDWDAFGRLAAVHDADGRTLARYRYDHRGLRDGKETAAGHEYFLHDANRQLIAHLDGAGRITRQYLYLGEAPLLLIDSPYGKSAAASGSFAALIDDFGTILASWLGLSRERLYWVHSNHLGAPEAITDARAQVVWRARYTPFGEVRAQDRIESPLRMDLRLPGQIFDPETGLHYNRARYYDPQTGQYLNPDPLGTPDGPNAYAYAAFNPLQFIDPDGLALFAFDGTGSDDRDRGYPTNVISFRNAYESGRIYYVSGVGTLHRDERYGDIRYTSSVVGDVLDSGGNYTGPRRIDRMMMYLMDEADATEDHEIMTVDIVGFSRGAAQARDFANRVAAKTRDGIYYYGRPDDSGQIALYCQSVNLRFIGLFDTVLSTNLSGFTYNLGIPDAFTHVAHAIALNEFRGEAFFTRPFGSIGAFPLESIHDGPYSPIPQPGRTRIEMGFIGSHSDIGGGHENDELSNVALNWMINQAGLAGIAMDSSPETLIKSPVIHDRSNATASGPPNERSEDRAVRYGSGGTTTQRKMILSAGMSFFDTHRYIIYQDRMDGDITGTVDAVEYVKWLKDNGYTITLEVQ